MQERKPSSAKETINKIENQPTKREKMFANKSDKELTAKIYKALIQQQKKKKKLKNGQRI